MTIKQWWSECKSWFAPYFIFLIFVAISFALSFQSFRKSYSVDQRVENYNTILNSILNLKIENYNIDSLNKVIVNYKLQQESYTEMLNRQSDWFIVYVTLLFFILGLFGFVVSNKAVADVKRKNSKDYSKQQKIQNEFIKEFNELKIDVYRGMTNIALLNIKTIENGTLEDVIPELIEVFRYYDKSLSLGLNEKDMIDILPNAFRTLLIGLKNPEVKEQLKIVFTKNDSKNLHNFIKHIEGIGAKTNREIKYICLEMIYTVNDITKIDKPV